VAGETFWGNPKATQAVFDKVKAAGYKSVRIPVTWLGKFGEAPEYKIDNDWLDRVAEVVGYAENAGLNAIVNIHHDGGDSKYWLDI
ncbi:cellulase family glycosylhydrolase, partial [Escherichia coli]|uniref:cellulase family glycosylhydrolase n=1 Tax=Escherichia coli TaxID=562 RepID=UPI0028E013F5